MKHHYISFFVVFASMLALLDGCANPDYLSASNEPKAPAPMVSASGSGVVEAIHVQQNVVNVDAPMLTGNQAQWDADATPVYRIRVRLLDGSTQIFLQDSGSDLHVGERVRLDSGRVYGT